jgi:hypothetical protein
MTRLGKRLLAVRLYCCSEEKELMETSICMCWPSKTSVSRLFGSGDSVWLVLLGVSLLGISGCSLGGSSSSKVQVGSIVFTDANAGAQKAITSLTVSQGTYVDVSLTNDSQLLGADWSVVCGSAAAPGVPLPPGQTQDESCGTFTPAHTMSGPVPGYAPSGAGYVTFYTAPAVPPKEGIVTLYASATSDHTRFSSVTLTVGGLPISVGFAPAPPATLAPGSATQFKSVLTNDAGGAGVNWTVICGSSACGSFSPAQTASGVVTSYTAPAASPNGDTVKVTATSIADPTKSATATIQIVPVSVSVTPAAVSAGTAEVRSLIAFVTNDGGDKGTDWSVHCTNTVASGRCGSITSHTASGAAATYTAPSLPDIAVGSAITITATSTADPTKSANSTVTAVKGSLVSGRVQAGQQSIRGALVSLYAATSDAMLNRTANINNASAVTTTLSDQDGNFAIPYGYDCPAPDTQMYLVSTGGNAGGGINADLALIAALGSCSQLDGARFVVNEATTVAAVHALNGFMDDAQHIGSDRASASGIVSAFATARDLVDVTTGQVRLRTVSGMGVVPQAKIDTLANLLNVCAKTAGSVPGDGSPCDQLFRATNPGTTPSAATRNSVQALLNLARNAISDSTPPGSFGAIYQLAQSRDPIGPVLSVMPGDWTLAIQYPVGQGGADSANLRNQTLATDGLPASGANPVVDSAGNVWVRRSDNTVMEFVGASSCAGAPKALVPIASSMNAQ